MLSWEFCSTYAVQKTLVEYHPAPVILFVSAGNILTLALFTPIEEDLAFLAAYCKLQGVTDGWKLTEKPVRIRSVIVHMFIYSW